MKVSGSVLTVMLLTTNPLAACFTPTLSYIDTNGINFARVVVSPAAAQMVTGGSNAILNGMNKWNQAPCQPQSGWVEPYPVFSTSQGSPAITVIREDRFSEALAGSGNFSCASFTPGPGPHDATIRLYSKIHDAQDRVYDCNWDSAERVALLVAHELGHYLGLGESNCTGSIMGSWSVSYNLAEGKATFLAAGHAIRDYECEKADQLAYTPSEEAWDDQQCSLDPNCDPYAPCWSDPSCSCPILVDLDRNQFHLAGTDDAVDFDIDADGSPETVTWTRRGQLDAFLCWDRNGNGIIEDGSELFGNSTPLSTGEIAPYGYIALAELDQPEQGGNGNGTLDEGDAVFDQLCLWTDLDHDGQTDSNELQGLAAAGLLALEVEPRTYPRRDAAGNLMLYSATAWIEHPSGPRRVATTDVFFVLVPD